MEVCPAHQNEESGWDWVGVYRRGRGWNPWPMRCLCYKSVRLRFRLVADPRRSMLVLSVVVIGGGPQDTRGFDLLRTNLNESTTCDREQ